MILGFFVKHAFVREGASFCCRRSAEMKTAMDRLQGSQLNNSCCSFQPFSPLRSLTHGAA